MDVYCPVSGCAEPVDMDYFHDVAEDTGQTYTQVTRDFAVRGCEALGDTHNMKDGASWRGEAASALYDLMGDDMDGVASMLEDAEYFGMFD